jgi:RHS repeat-associated protein
VYRNISASAVPSWAPASSTLFEYDTNTVFHAPPIIGELRRIKSWDNQKNAYYITQFEYDSRGNKTKTTDPTGAWTATEYDCNYGRYPIKKYDRLSFSTRDWDIGRGLLKSETNINSGVTSYGYDELSRPTLVTYPDAGFKETQYIDFGTPSQRVVTRISDDSVGDGVLWSAAYFDGLGRAYQIVKEGTPYDLIKRFEFEDASRRIAKESAFALATESTLWTTYAYDAAKRPLVTTYPDGRTLQKVYKVGFVEEYDPLNQKKEIHFDGFRRLTMVRERHRTCNARGENCSAWEFYDTHYEYDALDNLVKVKDTLGNESIDVWDSLSRRLRKCASDLGCWSYTYRDNGQLETETNARKQVQVLGYDSLNRVTSRIYKESDGRQTRAVSWTFDRISGATQGASIGQVVRIEDTEGRRIASEQYAYDTMGRPTSLTKCIEGTCKTIKTTFDRAARQKTVTYPDGEQIIYEYDTAGRLFRIPGIINSIFYNSRSQKRVIHFANGLEERSYYHPTRHWISASILWKWPAIRLPLYRASYTYDAAGRPETHTIYNGQSLDLNFVYDDLNRLKSVTSTADPTQNQAFDYDAIGNIRYNSKKGKYAYDDPAHVHAVSGITAPNGTVELYTYDANGNMKSGGDLAIRWTPDDRPFVITNNSTSVTTIYAYDPTGERISKKVGNNTTLYYGALVELSPSGDLIKYYYADGKLLARRDAAGALSFYHKDYLGSVRLTTDMAGAPANRHDYAPFGSATTGARFGFAGHESDDESSLVYMKARYYAPGLGRFVSSDKIIPDPLNPQTLNRYTYAANNPLSYVDPTGHAPDHLEVWNPAFPLNVDFFLGRLSYRAPEQPDLNLVSSRGYVTGPGVCMGYDECRSKPAASPARSATRIKFRDEEATVIVSATGSTNGARELQSGNSVQAPAEQLHEIARENRILAPDLAKTEAAAKSELIEMIPVLGPAIAIGYNVFKGDKAGAAETAVEWGLEHSLGKLITDMAASVIMAPYNAYKLHRAMGDHGENVEKMRDLEMREYNVRSRMGDPDARFNLYGGWQMGPSGRLLRDGAPAPRIQTGEVPQR